MMKTRWQPEPEYRLADELEALAGEIVDAAYTVHRQLGPGLLEHVYETCLAHELHRRGLRVQRQVMLSIRYDDIEVEEAFHIDLLVNKCIVLELKSVERLQTVHTAQVLTYLKLAGLRLGFLINFNVPVVKDGIRRIVRPT